VGEIGTFPSVTLFILISTGSEGIPFSKTKCEQKILDRGRFKILILMKGIFMQLFFVNVKSCQIVWW
jgi:hypothetical protein